MSSHFFFKVKSEFLVWWWHDQIKVEWKVIVLMPIDILVVPNRIIIDEFEFQISVITNVPSEKLMIYVVSLLIVVSPMNSCICVDTVFSYNLLCIMPFLYFRTPMNRWFRKFLVQLCWLRLMMIWLVKNQMKRETIGQADWTFSCTYLVTQ